MSRHQELIDACRRGDHPTIGRLGFGEVLHVLNTWWAPKATCSAQKFLSYAQVLGDEQPEEVLGTILEITKLNGDWPPLAPKIKAHLHRNDNDGGRASAGRNRDPATTPAALAATLEALSDGAQVCTCGPPTAIRWNVKADGVWRCPTCDGLEQGQVYAVEDAGEAAS